MLALHPQKKELIILLEIRWKICYFVCKKCAEILLERG